MTTDPKTETRTVTRKRTYEVGTLDEVMAVLAKLLSERHTGPVTIHLGMGGLRGMCAEDRLNLPVV